MKNKTQSFIALGSAIVLFVLRYVKFYHYQKGLVNMHISLSNAAKICELPFFNMVQQCSYVTPINIVIWILIIGLLGFGVYKFFK